MCARLLEPMHDNQREDVSSRHPRMRHRMDASSSDPEPERNKVFEAIRRVKASDVFNTSLLRMQAIYERRLGPVALAQREDICSAPAARSQETEESPSLAAPTIEVEQPDDIPKMRRSSLRRASPERRSSLAGICWDKDLEAVRVIPGRKSMSHALPPSSVSAFKASFEFKRVDLRPSPTIATRTPPPPTRNPSSSTLSSSSGGFQCWGVLGRAGQRLPSAG
ncbi:hypothetical protein T484DRAFT_1755893, partial [Baffinella frigidus]